MVSSRGLGDVYKRQGGIKGLVTTLKDTSIGKFEKGRQLSEGMMALAGLTHAIEKSPVKRGVFARNFELGMRKAIKDGENPHDELVQLRVGGQAYVAADRAILMNEHGLVKGYTSMSVSYTHLTLPTIHVECRSRWSPCH